MLPCRCGTRRVVRASVAGRRHWAAARICTREVTCLASKCLRATDCPVSDAWRLSLETSRSGDQRHASSEEQSVGSRRSAVPRSASSRRGRFRPTPDGKEQRHSAFRPQRSWVPSPSDVHAAEVSRSSPSSVWSGQLCRHGGGPCRCTWQRLDSLTVLRPADFRTSPFPADPAALFGVRARIRTHLQISTLEPREIDDVVLAVEEACTNAIRHSRSEKDIDLSCVSRAATSSSA